MNTAAPKPGLWARSRNVVLEQLRRGITPHQLALTVAVSSALALFPALGTTTLLCLAAGAALRLNHPLMQLVNYLLSGVQLLLILPLWKAGQWLGAPAFSLSLDEVKARVEAAPWQALADFGGVMLGGIGFWAICAPVWVALVYAITRPLFTAAVARRLAAAAEAAAGPPAA
ncbi:Uncharacterized conserved protein, DUF2062 family [Hydrocarboniphaga daqingensis]|jgi:uncharacterized protein (DUF2062 family)|uniref:Uncharacterized conserved protein, DUF2062 family n=1 Tax=Hydrocarboniphaga daqingensis TaxID=490188 RepID=A0A1M5LPB3_9GAMM|nr:DUF2062 domain-containing protein [Hydrocarboniphaga daqingensis]SHG66927.1 Uncharacterized conserved protein, DUF2062 family [Hydrocarboniphaga daqingensis]